MIRLIIIIALFFAVLALAPFLLEEPGYILISMGNHIVELTVYAAFFWISATLAILFLSYKFIRGGFNLSFKAWTTIAFASRRRGIANFNKGLTAYMLEDYQNAEQLFAKSAEPSKRQQSAYLLAAAASAKQNVDANTNHYLDLLEKESTKKDAADLASLIVKIKLLLNQQRDDAYKKARAIIDENHKKIGHDTQLLALEIDLCLIEKRFEAAISWFASARKAKNIDDSKIVTWEETAYYGAFKNIFIKKDKQGLQDYWESLSRKVKQRDSVFFTYCKVLAEHNISEPLIKLLSPKLKKQPNKSFLQHLRTLTIRQSEPLITIVQKHLHNNKHSALWLSCLGHLSVMSEQWSMAEKSFRTLIQLEANKEEKQYDKEDLIAFAKALTADGQHQTANEVWVEVNNW